ncbi:MAG: two-component sensor histidine kinase, partial [Lachnospiraceae bacterium]|nr:two-component sensor histidine kinase [Lachnospiraceae bacterium]
MNTFYYALLLDNGTVLRVSTQARTITNLLFTALPVIIGIVVVILFGCVFIGHFFIRQLMKPLEEMADNIDDNSAPVYKELEPFAYKIRSQHENILAAARSRQDFTANVSHELKTPITAILGYAELIENKMVDKES